MKFDYTNKSNLKDVWKAIEALDNNQLEEIGTIAKNMQEDEKRKRQQDIRKWIEQITLPILQRVAKINNGQLSLEWQDSGLSMVATISSDSAIYFENDAAMNIILALANGTSISEKNGVVELWLLFDLERLAS